MKHIAPRSSLPFSRVACGGQSMFGDEACGGQFVFGDDHSTAGVWFPESGSLFLVDAEDYDRAFDAGEEYAPVLRILLKVRTRADAWRAVCRAN